MKPPENNHPVLRLVQIFFDRVLQQEPPCVLKALKALSLPALDRLGFTESTTLPFDNNVAATSGSIGCISISWLSSESTIAIAPTFDQTSYAVVVNWVTESYMNSIGSIGHIMPQPLLKEFNIMKPYGVSLKKQMTTLDCVYALQDKIGETDIYLPALDVCSDIDICKLIDRDYYIEANSQLSFARTFVQTIFNQCGIRRDVAERDLYTSSLWLEFAKVRSKLPQAIRLLCIRNALTMFYKVDAVVDDNVRNAYEKASLRIVRECLNVMTLYDITSCLEYHILVNRLKHIEK